MATLQNKVEVTVGGLDSKAGYTVENCVPCCLTCNRAKSDLSVAQFKSWINAVYRRLE